MADAIHDRPARLEPLARKGKHSATPGWTLDPEPYYDCFVTKWGSTVTQMSNLDGSTMKKRANMLGKLLAPPVNPANGRLSSKELEKDGPGGNPLLERSSWTSEIDRELCDAGVRSARSRRFSLYRSSLAPD